MIDHHPGPRLPAAKDNNGRYKKHKDDNGDNEEDDKGATGLIRAGGVRVL